MAVKLRLTRVGKTKQPQYRIVAADSRSPRDGRFIEIIGTYNPRTEPSTLKVDNDKAVKWLMEGAQPTASNMNSENNRAALSSLKIDEEKTRIERQSSVQQSSVSTVATWLGPPLPSATASCRAVQPRVLT